MVIFLTWLALSIVAGILANNKGRSGFGFFALSLLLSPLVGLTAAAVASPNSAKIEETQMASGDSKKCPYCAEIVKREAIVCRFCSRELQSSAPDKPAGRTVTHDELMAHYGISHDGEKYLYGGQSFTKLEDAAAYAKQTQAPNRASI